MIDCAVRRPQGEVTVLGPRGLKKLVLGLDKSFVSKVLTVFQGLRTYHFGMAFAQGVDLIVYNHRRSSLVLPWYTMV